MELIECYDPKTKKSDMKDKETGKLVVDYIYSYVDKFFDGMAVVKRGGYFGFIEKLLNVSMTMLRNFQKV